MSATSTTTMRNASSTRLSPASSRSQPLMTKEPAGAAGGVPRTGEDLRRRNVCGDTASRGARARIPGLGGTREADGGQGVKLRLLDLDETEYTGDAHVYYWYRGTAVGPHPCVSALLALEKFIDQLIDQGC